MRKPVERLRFEIKDWVPPAGFEPATLGLKGRPADVRGRPRQATSRLNRWIRIDASSADIRPSTAQLLSRLLSLRRGLAGPSGGGLWESGPRSQPVPHPSLIDLMSSDSQHRCFRFVGLRRVWVPLHPV